MAHQNHEHEELEYRYYAEKEVMLHVEHGGNWFGGAEAEITIGTLLPLLRSLFASKEGALGTFPQEVDETVIASRFVPPENPNEFTLVLLRWSDSDLSVAEFVSGLNTYIKENEQPLELIDEGSGEQGELRPALINWYMGASSHIGIGVHGPGRRPRPIINPVRIDEQDFVVTKPALSTKLQSNGECESSVDVYILDTLPDISRLEDAWAEWGSTTLNRFQKIFTPLFNSEPNTYTTERATYYKADPNDFVQTSVTPPGEADHPIVLRDCYKDVLYEQDHQEKPEYHHDYDSSDHGLFIAGIIHGIVPEANLHVIEVMNNRGIGTFWNLTQGFKKVSNLQKISSRKAIINCSFTLALPNLLEEVCVDSNKIGLVELAQLVADLIKSCLDLIEAVRQSIQGGALMVAAAGNDSNAANPLKSARALANTDLAVGVGALDKNGNIASYSNKADDPLIDGFMVFGGDYREDAIIDPNTNDYEDSGGGVIGIFTLPGIFEVNSSTSVPNDFGLAEWAGTSFAAPILAGTLAKLMIAEACRGEPITPAVAISTIKSHSRQIGIDVAEKPDKKTPWTFSAIEQKNAASQEASS